ncbi:MAG: PEFG-CTERM sorting domain-containing protein [Nitrosotalea sp.]
MKSKQYRVFFGLLALVAIIGIASETTIMTASAQSTITRHCTAYRPCYNICGDHICAPGELAQMKAQSAQPQNNNTGVSIAPVNSTMTTQSTGVIIGGVVSYMDIASDGTAVIVRTGHPISGQTLAIGIGFRDANDNFVQNQNYAITVTQDGNTVFSNPNGNAQTGTDTLTTPALSSNSPVNIMVTLNGVGPTTADPSTWTGVKGEVLGFSQVTDVKTPTMPISNMTMPQQNATVPEFGSVASIVLAIAVLSVVVFAVKTRIIPKF